MDKNTIFIEDSAWDKIISYARTCYEMLHTEIGGMAVVRKNKENNWIISDPAILKQEATASICHLDQAELSIWYSTAAEKYKDDLINGNLMYLWWHSHHNMGASMSQTDWNTIGDTETGLSLVVNNKGEYELILSAAQPIPLQVKCSLTKLSSFEEDITIKKEIEDLVSKNTVPVTKYNKYSGFTPRRALLNGNVADQFSMFDEQELEIPRIATVSEEEVVSAELEAEAMKDWNESFGEDVESLDAEANIDYVMLNVDRSLDALKSSAVTPQEVIDEIESINKQFDKPIFRVPNPKEVLEISNSTELMTN